MTTGAHEARPARAATTTGLVLGVALMGAIDEILFHQLLQWHHFYLHTTQFWRIVSDGLFHAFTASLWLVGAAMLWHRRHVLSRVVGSRVFWGAILLGMGGFQVFDGVVNHKLLGLHAVREGADPMWPYDAAWIVSGLVLAVEGWVLLRSARRRAARA